MRLGKGPGWTPAISPLSGLHCLTPPFSVWQVHPELPPLAELHQHPVQAHRGPCSLLRGLPPRTQLTIPACRLPLPRVLVLGSRVLWELPLPHRRRKDASLRP